MFKLPEPTTVAIRALDPLFLSLVDAYWAHFLGCSPVKLRNDRTHLLSHVKLDDPKAITLTFVTGQRTEWNVRDSDATVLFSIEATLTGGSNKTVEFARKHNKPWLHVCAGDKAAADKLKAFFEEHRVKVVNVAGPRASKEPGVGEFVVRTLEEAFSDIAG